MTRDKELNMYVMEEWPIVFCGSSTLEESLPGPTCEKDGRGHKSLAVKAKPMIKCHLLLTGVEALLCLFKDGN